MTYPKPSNSSFRYLLAGLKPLANVKVWGSVAIMALVAFVFWQYYQHPEWLGSDQLPSVGDSEVEAEIGNSVDIGVTVQDLEQNRLRSQEPLQNPNNPILRNNPESSLLPPSADGDNTELNQPNASIKFEPLMPNVKNLGSLFPPLTPSDNADKPIEIPDTLQNKGKSPQNNALENALEDVFSQESPSNLPENNNRPATNRNPVPQSTYPTTIPPRPNNPYPTQPYTQPYTQSNPPYNYTPPQPYSRPYGNGVAPAPVPAYPPSNQLPNNTYGNINPNPNYANPGNRNRPTPNYGMQPPQVNQYGETNY